MENKIVDKTPDISGKTGKVWVGRKQCWCPAEIIKRGEAPGMWVVECMPGSSDTVRMGKVSRSSIRIDNEYIPGQEKICMSGGSYKKYKLKKRKTKNRKSKKRKRSSRKSKTRRRR